MHQCIPYGYDEDNRIDHIFDDLTVDGTAYNTIWMCLYDEYGRLQFSASYPFIKKEYAYTEEALGSVPTIIFADQVSSLPGEALLFTSFCLLLPGGNS